MTPYHEHLLNDPVTKVGFYDNFGRHHWAPTKELTEVKKRIAEHIGSNPKPETHL